MGNFILVLLIWLPLSALACTGLIKPSNNNKESRNIYWLGVAVGILWPLLIAVIIVYIM